MKCGKFSLICALLLALSQFSGAAENVGASVILVERLPIDVDERVPQSVRDAEAAEIQASFSEYRQRLLDSQDDIERMLDHRLRGMRTSGSVIVPVEQIPGSYDEGLETMGMAWVDYSEVASRLGYTGLSLRSTPFEGRLTGVWGNVQEDKLIHSLNYRFEVPGVGEVFVDEVSYETSPQAVFVAINRPLGNISVKGNLGSFVVYRNEEGDRVNAEVEVRLGGRLITLRSYSPAMLNPKGPEVAAFLELASYLN